jgi:hypothetical protein
MKKVYFIVSLLLIFFSNIVFSQEPFIDATAMYNQYGDTALVDNFATEININSLPYYLNGCFAYAPTVKLRSQYVRFFKFYLTGTEEFYINAYINTEPYAHMFLFYKYGNGNEDNAIMFDNIYHHNTQVGAGLYVLNLISLHNDSALYALFINSYKEYMILSASTPHGALAPSKVTALQGEIITVIATPDEGYELDVLSATTENGETIEVTADNKFVMPNSNVTVTATFQEIGAGVPQTSASSLLVFASERTITVQNAVGEVQVLDISGRVAAQGAGAGEYAVQQAGAYFVKADGAVRKVIVK